MRITGGVFAECFAIKLMSMQRHSDKPLPGPYATPTAMTGLRKIATCDVLYEVIHILLTIIKINLIITSVNKLIRVLLEIKNEEYTVNFL